MGVSEVFSRPQEQEGTLLFLEQDRAGIAGGCCPSHRTFCDSVSLL